MSLDYLRDVVKLTQVFREHRETCRLEKCSPRFVDRGGEPFIVDCMELSELPNFPMSCCCGIPDCPGYP